jgi:hypothetical protein
MRDFDRHPAASETMVPLSAVAISDGNTPPRLITKASSLSSTISFNLAPNVSLRPGHGGIED